MNRLFILSVSVICCLVGLVSPAEAVEPGDQVILRGSSFRAIVEHETRDGISYRVTPSQTNLQTRRWSEVVDIIYAGMDGGNYLAGMQAMSGGRYEEAAVRFESLAVGAKREWEGFMVSIVWERPGSRRANIKKRPMPLLPWLKAIPSTAFG